MSLRTARKSRIRSLTVSRPKWSVIQDALGFDKIQLIFTRFPPRQGQDGVEIGPDNGRFGGNAGHPFEAVDFLEHPVFDFSGHPALRDLGAELVKLAAVFAAELVVDGLELFAKVVLALVAVDLVSHTIFDAPLECGDFDLGG